LEEVRPEADVPVPSPLPLQTPAPPAAQQLEELLVGGHPFQVASSTEISEIDLPANSALLQSNGAPPTDVTEDDAPMREIADATKSDFANVTPTPERDADVGSASWMLQALAAFAGAVAAGAVAWFLIGRRPTDAATRSWRVWIQLLLVPPAFSTKRPLVRRGMSTASFDCIVQRITRSPPCLHPFSSTLRAGVLVTGDKSRGRLVVYL
jgi:hypothetical protein